MAAKKHSPSAVPSTRLAALNQGTVESRNLAEGLAIDQQQLLQHTVCHRLTSSQSAQVLQAAATLSDQGITRKIAGIATAIQQVLGPNKKAEATLQSLAQHPSDTVRSWAAYIVGRDPKLNLRDRLLAIRPLAADKHFGVREWAWMAVRPAIATEPLPAIGFLTPWVQEADPNLRRFTIEATRPRGVWCAHITQLKETPEPARVLLDPLCRDEARYVQDSVANWLNDASKSRPDWVQQLCKQWQARSPHPETERIVRRALRTLNKPRS